jgi:1-acyl-sn-glycerol-3-phosphate acyltransferase
MPQEGERARTSTVPPAPGPLRYHALRLVLAAVTRAYLRLRISGADRLPDGPYLLCFNHPSWLDPVVLAAAWPDKRRLSIFGPREQDMSRGWRNHLITWTRRGVPFKPAGADVLDAARRAAAVLRRGDILAVAGEGRLSDREDQVLPIETGVAHFALMAQVPIVPVGIHGTRWVRFRGTVHLRVGAAITQPAGSSGRAAAAELTARTQAALEELLADVRPAKPPGPFGRWLSEAFNDRTGFEGADDRH